MYAGLHIAALAALGPGLLLSPLKPWTGVTALASVPVFGTILAGTKDIPPFAVRCPHPVGPLNLADPQQIWRLVRLGQPGGPAHGHSHSVGNNGAQPAVVGH